LTPRTLAGHSFDRANVPLLLTLGLGVFAGALDLGVLSPALPALARSFHIGPSAVAWVFTLYLFANVVSIPIAGKFADAWGRRPAYVGCVGLFAAASVLAIAAPNFATFLIARALQAAGAGGIFPVAAAAIADRVPPERRGSALGMLGAIWGLAAIVGPAFGGLVTHFISWHWIFVANVPLAAIVIVLAVRYVPTSAARVRGPLDLAGLGTLALGLIALMVALTHLDARAAVFGGAPTAWTAIGVALVAFVAFAAIERRAAEPVIATALFARRQLAVTYTLELGIGALEGALFFIPAALVAADRLSYAAAGGIAAIGAITFVAVIPLAGRALDAFGSRAVLLVGSLCSAAGLWIFANVLSDLPLAIGAIVLAGIGFGALLGAPTRYIVTNETPSSRRATAVGLLSICLIVGQILGGSLAGGIAGSDIASVAGYRGAYEAFAAIALVIAAGTFALASRRAELLRADSVSGSFREEPAREAIRKPAEAAEDRQHDQEIQPA
jgi:MFS family permease